MFLTHMPLNPQRRRTRELLASPQRMHAAVLGAFPPGAAQRGRILWRVDAPERHQLDLYLVSVEEPSLESVVEQAGWTAQPTWRTTPYGRFLASLEAGQQWAFRLRANPVASVRPAGATDGSATTNAPRGRRVPLIRSSDQIAWLDRQGQGKGFRLTAQPSDGRPNVIASDEAREAFVRGYGDDRRKVTLSTVVFTGLLEVHDPVELRTALRQGIGPAKGYGCGLMTLARPR